MPLRIILSDGSIEGDDSTDKNVAVSANDAQPGNLITKIINTDGKISFTEQDDGVDERFVIATSAATIAADLGYTPLETLHWGGVDPGSTKDALDNVAQRLTTVEEDTNSIGGNAEGFIKQDVLIDQPETISAGYQAIAYNKVTVGAGSITVDGSLVILDSKNISATPITDVYFVQSPPEDPTAYDDEFNDVNGTSPDVVKWTQWDYGGRIFEAITQSPYGLKIRWFNWATDFSGYYQDLPDNNFTVDLLVYNPYGQVTGSGTAYKEVGMVMLANGTTSGGGMTTICTRTTNSSATVKSFTLTTKQYSSYTASSTYSGPSYSVSTFEPRGYYLRFQGVRTAANVFDVTASHSVDGLLFFEMDTISTVSALHIGIYVGSYYPAGAGDAVDEIAYFGFFRYRNSSVPKAYQDDEATPILGQFG